MGAEERTHRAIFVTRSTLERVLLNPGVLISMVAANVGPDDVEDVITMILGYLDKTEPESLAEGGK